MNLPNYPEDSVLKRHFDASVEIKRQMWLQLPPTDSVLNRHAVHQGGRPGSSAAPRRAAPAPAVAPASARPVPQARSEPKGFFAWLSGLFSSRA